MLPAACLFQEYLCANDTPVLSLPIPPSPYITTLAHGTQVEWPVDRRNRRTAIPLGSYRNGAKIGRVITLSVIPAPTCEPN